jgi:hypothetical protein
MLPPLSPPVFQFPRRIRHYVIKKDCSLQRRGPGSSGVRTSEGNKKQRETGVCYNWMPLCVWDGDGGWVLLTIDGGGYWRLI